MDSTGTNEFGGYDGDQQATQQKSDGGGLRAKLEEALQRAKAAEDKNAELEKSLTARAKADLFKEFGVPDKIQKFYNGDPTKEAITEWIKENADVFGITLDAAKDTSSPEDQERNDALRATQAASRIGFESNNNSTQTALSEAEAKLKAGTSEAELDDIINKMFNKR